MGVNMINNTDEFFRYKCDYCRTEIIVDGLNTVEAKCYLCGCSLTKIERISSKDILDTLLPFKVSQEEAEIIIKDFIKKNKYNLNPKLKKKLLSQSVMGVYFSCLVLDVNAQVLFSGEGEHQTDAYKLEICGNKEQYNSYDEYMRNINKLSLYNADVYYVERSFNLNIKKLVIDVNVNDNNNIIDELMPFDLDNVIKYDEEYLNYFHEDKLKEILYRKVKSAARSSCNETLDIYDRGVRWDYENVQITSLRGRIIYLPVWLCSYLEVKGNKKTCRYLAINGRTKRLTTNLPMYFSTLLFICFLAEVTGVLFMFLIPWKYNWLFLSLGFICFVVLKHQYRNSKELFDDQENIMKDISNLKQIDNFIRVNNAQTSKQMKDANNRISK